MIFRWRTIFDTQPAHTKIIKWYIPLNDFSPVYHYLHTTGTFKILRSHLMIFRRCTTIYTQPAPSKFWEAT